MSGVHFLSFLPDKACLITATHFVTKKLNLLGCGIFMFYFGNSKRQHSDLFREFKKLIWAHVFKCSLNLRKHIDCQHFLRLFLCSSKSKESHWWSTSGQVRSDHLLHIWTTFGQPLIRPVSHYHLWTILCMCLLCILHRLLSSLALHCANLFRNWTLLVQDITYDKTSFLTDRKTLKRSNPFLRVLILEKVLFSPLCYN